jgi:hypothetical protein
MLQFDVTVFSSSLGLWLPSSKTSALPDLSHLILHSRSTLLETCLFDRPASNPLFFTNQGGENKKKTKYFFSGNACRFRRRSNMVLQHDLFECAWASYLNKSHTLVPLVACANAVCPCATTCARACTLWVIWGVPPPTSRLMTSWIPLRDSREWSNDPKPLQLPLTAFAEASPDSLPRVYATVVRVFSHHFSPVAGSKRKKDVKRNGKWPTPFIMCHARQNCVWARVFAEQLLGEWRNNNSQTCSEYQPCGLNLFRWFPDALN